MCEVCYSTADIENHYVENCVAKFPEPNRFCGSLFAIGRLMGVNSVANIALDRMWLISIAQN